MNESARHTDVWLWLTFPIAILLAIATAGGVLVNDHYRDNRYYVAQAVGQDFISLTVVLPTLVATAFLTSRGSARARLVWLGGLVYLVYTYVWAAFDNSFNSLFLVYVALLGCSLYALIGGLVTTNLSVIKERFTGKTPVKAVSLYFAVLAVLFYSLWLSELVPALLAGEIPQSVQANGTPTNAAHVLDMAWILPALGITAVGLWRKRALGYTLAGVLLSYIVLLALALLSIVVSMIRRGYPVIVPQVVIFGGLFAISLGMLIWYLRGVSSTSISK